MDTELTPEQSKALEQTDGMSLPVFDPVSNKKYVLIPADEFNKLESIAAIKEGIRQMENGEGQPLDEAMFDVRSSLKEPN